jgi:hypothetical protein
MNGKLEYEYFRLQKLEKMFWNRTYGHVRIILFGETNFDANGKCTMQDEKVRIFQLEMVLSSRSKDTVRNSLTLF